MRRKPPAAKGDGGARDPPSPEILAALHCPSARVYAASLKPLAVKPAKNLTKNFSVM